MAFTLALRVLLFAFLAALVAVAYSSDNDNTKSAESRTFTSKLIGANEVPKDDSEAVKKAVGDKTGVVDMKLKIYREDGKPRWVEFTVQDSNMEGEMPPTKTHVHPGRKGENNPVLLDLTDECQYEKTGDEEWRCKGTLGKDSKDKVLEWKLREYSH
ncbi:hypothetical protein CLOM_g20799 [Closterium sp. NIES-68]|nr:hypothetical protein CLOM_g20799 [Closterium sp. NIES-68]GJP81382.1 hypothetical protein CLOP_g11542 [Closterium sp. NIES-67]